MELRSARSIVTGSFTGSGRASGRRRPGMTSYPALARRSAVARPIPLLAPVTKIAPRLMEWDSTGMRVGLLQVAAGEDKDANRDAVVAGVRELADAGAQLIVAPEASMHGFGMPDLPLAPVAEPLEGPFVSALAAAAKEHGVTVLAGMFEPVEDD